MGSGQGAGSCCAKSILIVTNIFFFLVGLAFFAAGIVVKFASQYVQPYVDQLTANIPSMAASANVSNPNSSTGGVSIDISVFFGDLVIVFITVGLFIMMVGVLGMCGACWTSKCMLILYSLIVFILLLAESAIVVIVVTGVFDTKIKEQMKIIVNNKYGGLDTYDAESLLLNVVQLQFKCCGIDDYVDFNTSTSWQRTRTFNETVGGVEYSVTKTLVTPIACCKMDANFPNGKPIDNNCAFSPNSTNSNYDKGCFQELQSLVVTTYKWPVIGAVAGILAFQLILAVLAIIISQSTSNKNSVKPLD